VARPCYNARNLRLSSVAISRSAIIRRWLARGLIAAVFLWNVQCAVAFLVAPATYTAGFELAGPAGAATVRGLGLLFLMWNVPYFVALLDPARRRVSLYEAIADRLRGGKPDPVDATRQLSGRAGHGHALHRLRRQRVDLVGAGRVGHAED
jgi:hypothetical protein